MANRDSGSNLPSNAVPRIKITFGGAGPVASDVSSEPIRMRLNTTGSSNVSTGAGLSPAAGQKRPRFGDHAVADIRTAKRGHAQTGLDGKKSKPAAGNSKGLKKGPIGAKSMSSANSNNGSANKESMAASDAAEHGSAPPLKKMTKRDKERYRALEQAKRDHESDQAEESKKVALSLPHANPSAESATAAIHAARVSVDEATGVARAVEEAARLDTDQSRQRAAADATAIAAAGQLYTSMAYQSRVLSSADLAALVSASKLAPVLVQAHGAPPAPRHRGGPAMGPAAPTTGLHPVSMPACAAWYHPVKIHSMERRAFPRWFDSSSASRTPEVYVRCRDTIVSMYRQLPHRYLSATAARKTLVVDAAFAIRLHRFLERWGVINYNVQPQSRPVPNGAAPASHWPVRVLVPLPGNSLDAGLGVSSESAAGGAPPFASTSMDARRVDSNRTPMGGGSGGGTYPTFGALPRNAHEVDRVQVARLAPGGIEAAGGAVTQIQIAPIVVQQGPLMSGVASDSGPSRAAWEIQSLLSIASSRVYRDAHARSRAAVAGMGRSDGPGSGIRSGNTAPTQSGAITAVLAEHYPTEISGRADDSSFDATVGALWTAAEDNALLEAVARGLERRASERAKAGSMNHDMGSGTDKVESTGGEVPADGTVIELDWHAVASQVADAVRSQGILPARTAAACLTRFIALGSFDSQYDDESIGGASLLPGGWSRPGGDRSMEAIARLAASAPPSVVQAASYAAREAFRKLKSSAGDVYLPYSENGSVGAAVQLALIQAGSKGTAREDAEDSSENGTNRHVMAARMVLAEAASIKQSLRRREARVLELEQLAETRWRYAERAMATQAPQNV